MIAFRVFFFTVVLVNLVLLALQSDREVAELVREEDDDRTQELGSESEVDTTVNTSRLDIPVVQ
eukprot:2200643-Amphidinium_carterae.1